MEFQQIGVEKKDLAAWTILVPVALLLTLIIVKPMPLFGGFADDFKYLIGAQCLSCLPSNHWETRFPITWPTGLAIQLFGQNTWSVMIAPISAGITSLLLTYKLVERQYGRVAGLIAASTLAITPVFTDRSMRVSIDVIELAFVLGSIFLIQTRKSQFWAGASLGLAVLCRPTELAALPLIGLLVWWQDRKSLGKCAFGFLSPIALEALVYAILVGDALYPWKLSLNHMSAWKASSDPIDFQNYMSPAVDITKSPLFNRDFIDGWAPLSGIDTHWTVQGFVNLLFNIECGITLLAAIAFSLVAAKKLDKLQIGLILGSAIYFGILTFVLAVDPRPRMFLLVIVVACALIGALGPQLWNWPFKIVPLTFLLIIPFAALVNMASRSDYSYAAKKADKLLANQPYIVTANARQRMSLTRQAFPNGGEDLIEIANRCPPRLSGRWLTSRDEDLCIYTRFPWPFEPYRNGYETTDGPIRWVLWPPKWC